MKMLLPFILLFVLSCNQSTSYDSKGKDNDSELKNPSIDFELKKPIYSLLDTASIDLVEVLAEKYDRQKNTLAETAIELVETEAYLAWGYAVLQVCDSAEVYINCVEDKLLHVKDSNSLSFVYANYSIGKALNNIAQYERAIPPLERAMNSLEKLDNKNFDILAEIYTLLANVHCLAGNYKLGLPYLKEAYQIRQKYFPDDTLKLIKAYSQIGVGHFYFRQLDSVLYYFQNTIDKYQELETDAASQIAELTSNIGLVYVIKQEFDTAIVYLNEALDLQRKLPKENPIKIANTLQNLTNAHISQSDPITAVKYAVEASEIAENALCDRHPELAYYLHSCGVVYRTFADYAKAEKYLNKGLAVAVNKPDLEALYQELGRVKYNLSENEKALELLNKALKLQSNNFKDTTAYNLGTTYISVALVLKEMKQYQAAIDTLDKAVTILKRYEVPLYLATAYNDLGLNYAELKDYEKAKHYIKLAIELIEKHSKTVYSLANSHYYLGSVYFNQKQYDKAEASFDTALVLLEYNSEKNTVEAASPLYAVLRILTAKAVLYQKYYLNDQKISYLLEADRLFAENFTLLSKVLQNYQDSKIYILNARFHAYEYAIKNKILLYKATGNDQYKTEAFQLSEKSKSALLQQSFLESTAKGIAEIPDSLLEKERTLKIQVAWLKEQLYLLSQESSLDEEQKNRYRIKLFDSSEQLESVLKQMEEDYPKYFGAKYEEYDLPIESIQESLITENQALLEYFVGDSSLFVFVVETDSIHIKEIKINFPLQEWIKDLRTSIENKSPKYVTSAHQLYLKLIQPIEQHLEKNKELLIIPDALLNNIPFDVLLTQKPAKPAIYKTHAFLMKKYTMSMAYSAYLLEETRSKKYNSSRKHFLGFAPQFFRNEQLATQNVSSKEEDTRGHLDPLTYNKEEVENILKIVKGKKLFEENASKANFLELAPQYQVLHLSTHGESNNYNGQYSFLAFSEEKDSATNDWLYNNEVYNLQLEADMVVLSACETNIGELQRAEGVLSLARGFTYAGAKSIVTTLWKIDDRSTSELMPLFYKNLKLGDAKHIALQKAKRHLLDKTQFAAPYYWAAFTPIGDMSPIKVKSNTFPFWIWLIVAAGLGSLLLFFFRKKSIS